MNEKKVSNERLNNHKQATNIMISDYNKAILAMSRINEKYLKVSNTPEIYRDKVYNIYNNLKEKNIDFWGTDFQLREAILFDLRLKIVESGTYLKIIMEKILLMPDIAIKNKLLNELSYKNMGKAIKEIQSIGESIRDYSIDQNIVETLIEYFKSIPVFLEKPQSITNKYQKMKKNIEDLGLENILKDKEEELRQIIEKKEEECLNNSGNEDNLRILFSEFQKIQEEKNNNDIQRTRK